MSSLRLKVQGFGNPSRYVQALNTCPENKIWLKNVFSNSLLHFHVNRLTTACFSTWVSAMRCFHAPEEKLQHVGCYLQRNARFGEHGFDLQYCDNQNFGQCFEKPQIDSKIPKISHFLLWNFCGKKSLLWWAYRKVWWLTITLTT